ncbi:MAG: PDZ domain-containing protein [Thermoanaerobaculales bacterium]|nr:PDZ domain-containing protein [Thermoanaerobaculales bacterium]
MTKRVFVGIFCLALAAAGAWADEGTGLLRFPDIHGDTVAFSYGGDLWLASTEGGTAWRLTAHPGQELFPRFSPDGKWIAFTGQYEGDEQVYVVPTTGGEPTRLTWYPAAGPLPPRWGYDHQVYGWTPDGEKVLFRSLRDTGGTVESLLYTVSRTGGLPVALPMPNSGAGDFSPDGGKMVYSPLFRDFRHWKRYQGGWAQNLYIFNLASHDVMPVSHSVRTERDPMWIGDTIYFVSDRTDHLNLFSFDQGSGKVAQLTDADPWDVRWPSTDNESRVIYELGGQLHILDVISGIDTAIVITVPDDGLWKRPRRILVSDLIEGVDLAPQGERALFVARGEVFSVPIEKGPVRNLTRSSGAHDRDAAWSPDGRMIAYISDAGGEDEIWLVDQAGKGESKRLTSGHEARLFRPLWSPDSSCIAFADKDGRLFVVEVENGSEILAADDIFGRLFDYGWSPDGAHIAFSLRNEAGVSRLHIWSAAGGELRQITSDLFNADSPAWGTEGKYLFYRSDRHYAPQISNIEWNFAGNRRGGIYAMTLRKDVEPLFPPESDEVKIDGDDSGDGDETEGRKNKDGDKDEADKQEKDESPEPVVIDFDGLASRVIRIPVEGENYNGLVAVKGHLLFGTSDGRFYGRSTSESSKLQIFSFEDREASTLVDSKVRGWVVSANGKKVLVRAEGGFKLYDVKPKADKPKAISTAGLKMDLVPTEEWAEIFDETWRRFRDYFYVDNMHGYDWKAIGARYRAQLTHVAHRSDLNYVISEMISELGAGHTYISGGDFEIPDRARVGLPGALFELDGDAGRYRIAAVYRGHNEESKYRSPLTEVGVNVSAGEYVLAIDGEELRATDNPYRLLQHKTDPVTLTVNGSPSIDGAREETYEPVTSESSLRYLQWVLGNFDKVTEMTDGRVGYMHIPDMGAPGIAEFVKWFYPQIRKEGFVVDVRGNGGGNVSQWIIERLDNKLLGTRYSHTSDIPTTYPRIVFHGHLACLLSETSASDGDIFPHYFRAAGLGPLIGKRSWGGVVGGGSTGLVDGGSVFVPRSSTNDAEGNYIIEGYGVDPDIEVENDPKSVIEGHDRQLERAVAEILAAMERDPKVMPTRPADPVKTPG